MSKPDNEWIKRRRTELLLSGTEAEVAAARNVRRLGLHVVRQYPVWTGRRMYFADLYIPSLRTILEIDGNYHQTQIQRRKDKNRSCGLRRLGYHVIRLSNHDAHIFFKISFKISLISSFSLNNT